MDIRLHTTVHSKQRKEKIRNPISFLNEPSSQELLCKAEQNFGFNHPIGGLKIPSAEEIFVESHFSVE
ncbi:hypothetical protein CUMW_214250 [Citrus unshiu]|uniref:Uncharacterized protein n=1 Tax=Citrus unshiu TaxID=55188 RepID=A0A2H5QBG4_CITUN|nr:hypothetical protein CUMW_214250 [Citrus unshiu]